MPILLSAAHTEQEPSMQLYFLIIGKQQHFVVLANKSETNTNIHRNSQIWRVKKILCLECIAYSVTR